jgi:plasmid stabilization system protein ParE
MNKYAVQWTAAAARDLELTVEYIAEDSPGQALLVLQKIRARASTLLTMPERGRIVPELKLHGISIYRELIIAPWRLIYRITDRIVHVHAVIDSRRNLEDILLARLIR